MLSVRINGQDSSINTGNVPKFGDLVELVKSYIDPEHMITGITLDGRDLEEVDWAKTLSQYGTAIVEFETGTPGEFVRGRLSIASGLLQAIYMQTRESRKCFQSGDMETGNRVLVSAVNDLKAFFEWYMSLMALLPLDQRTKYDIAPHVESISSIAKRICQQQLYQSWWALSESLEKELEPALDKLEDFLRKMVA